MTTSNKDKDIQTIQYLKAARGLQDNAKILNIQHESAKNLLSTNFRSVNEIRSELAAAKHSSSKNIKQLKLEFKKMDAVIQNAQEYQRYLANQIDLEFLNVKKLEAELAQSEKYDT